MTNPNSDPLPIGTCATCPAEQGCNEPFRSEWCRKRREKKRASLPKLSIPTSDPTAIRPCPWCGTDDNHIELQTDNHGDWRVNCEMCVTCGPAGVTEADAITAWNRRAPKQAFVGGFDPCCGQPPKITEWRPGCYGAQCMECGGIVSDERQLDRNELMAEWNRVMRNRTANATGERSAKGNDHG